MKKKIAKPNLYQKIIQKENIDRNTFSVMKIQNREKFDFIFSFDKNPDTSYEKYKEYVENTISKLQQITYDNKEDIKKILKKYGYKSDRSWYNFEESLFSLKKSAQSVRYSQFKRYEKILKELECAEI